MNISIDIILKICMNEIISYESKEGFGYNLF